MSARTGVAAFLAEPFSAFGRHWSLTRELTKRDVLGRYRGASFGLLWSVLSPFLMLLVYTVAFGSIFKSRWPQQVEGGPDYTLILFVGLIVHGFFTVGNPDETVEDMNATFDFASKLPLDTFGFNRLCVYRGTPLWQEYVKRGLVNEATDWYKYFKCSEIDPTCLPGEVINQVRQEGLRRLFLYKIFHYPIQTYRLLRRFLRFMPVRDVVYLIMKPFLGQKKGATKAEVLSRAVEHADMKDAAAQLTQLTDDMLHKVLTESRAERLRIQQEAGSSRELPMVPAP